MSRKYLQHDVIYFITDTGDAAYSPDGVGIIYFDEAQTETGIIQTDLEQFAAIEADE